MQRTGDFKTEPDVTHLCSNHLYLLLLTRGRSRPGGQTQAHNSLLPHKPGMVTVCGCLRKKSRFRTVGWRGGVSSRVRESFLFYIPRCYLLENRAYLFFFFNIIDFSRVGGITHQMGKKGEERGKASPAGRFWKEPQPCFGLGSGQRKRLRRPQPVWLQRCRFPPEFQHRPSPPRLLPRCQPLTLPHLFQALQSGGACAVEGHSFFDMQDPAS